MIKNYNQSVEINHNPNCPYISNHPYRISIIFGSESDKTNALLNLIKINGKILTRLTYMSKIHSNQSINCLLTQEEK